MRSVPGETLSNEYGSLTCFTVYSPSLVAVTAGFSRLLESPGFLFVKFPGLESPGKWVWPWKVLEILMTGPGKSWNFLGYDVGGGHSDADAGAIICKN